MLFKARLSLLFLQTVEHSLQLTPWQDCSLHSIHVKSTIGTSVVGEDSFHDLDTYFSPTVAVWEGDG